MASSQLSRRPSPSVFCGGGGEPRLFWNHIDFSLNQLVKLVLLLLHNVPLYINVSDRGMVLNELLDV